MTHFELVQTATDFLAESREPQRWLAEYDEALASSSDRKLIDLISRFHNSLKSKAA